MNKYRWIGDSEGYNEFACLNCHNQFLHYDRPTNWKCCPFCLIEWDGEFTKRNRRGTQSHYTYTEPRFDFDYDGTVSYCNEPTLFLQSRRVTDRVLDPESFGVRFVPRHYTRWQDLYNCRIGIETDEGSSSVWMMRRYREYCRQCDDDIRLILMMGTEIRVIKHRAKDGQSQIRQKN